MEADFCGMFERNFRSGAQLPRYFENWQQVDGDPRFLPRRTDETFRVATARGLPHVCLSCVGLSDQQMEVTGRFPVREVTCRNRRGIPLGFELLEPLGRPEDTRAQSAGRTSADRVPNGGKYQDTPCRVTAICSAGNAPSRSSRSPGPEVEQPERSARQDLMDTPQLRRAGTPSATKNITLLPMACGEKKSMTTSS